MDITDLCFLHDVFPGSTETAVNKVEYDLKAIICHKTSDISERTRGKGSKDLIPIDCSAGRHLGHHYMCTKDRGDNWTICDDGSVETYDTTILHPDGNPNVSSEAYVLLYC